MASDDGCNGRFALCSHLTTTTVILRNVLLGINILNSFRDQ